MTEMPIHMLRWILLGFTLIYQRRIMQEDIEGFHFLITRTKEWLLFGLNHRKTSNYWALISNSFCLKIEYCFNDFMERTSSR